MSIEHCCGTTCDRAAVIAELRQLREFKARTLALLRAADANREPLGKLEGGMLSAILDDSAPVALTNYRSGSRCVHAYLLPEPIVRELLLMEKEK